MAEWLAEEKTHQRIQSIDSNYTFIYVFTFVVFNVYTKMICVCVIKFKSLTLFDKQCQGAGALSEIGEPGLEQ